MKDIIASDMERPRERKLIMGKTLYVQFAHQILLGQSFGLEASGLFPICGGANELLGQRVESHLDGLVAPSLAQSITESAQEELSGWGYQAKPMLLSQVSIYALQVKQIVLPFQTILSA